jgi:hypothetical protein
MSEKLPILIAHRGLVDGPDKDKENSISAILAARHQGFDVEIDLWYQNYCWYLGHDEPKEQIPQEWLLSWDNYDGRHHLWIHAKSISTLYQLRRIWAGHVFFHENDPCVLTSSGYIWTFPGKELTPGSICVMPEVAGVLGDVKNLNVAGYCSDYVRNIRETLNS